EIKTIMEQVEDIGDRQQLNAFRKEIDLYKKLEIYEKPENEKLKIYKKPENKEKGIVAPRHEDWREAIALLKNRFKDLETLEKQLKSNAAKELAKGMLLELNLIVVSVKSKKPPPPPPREEVAAVPSAANKAPPPQPAAQAAGPRRLPQPPGV